MKNKKLTYLLGVVVIGVWGLIIYRLLSAAGGADDPSYGNVVPRIPEKFDDYTLPKDTVHLLLSYRDPFSPAKAETPEIPVSELVHQAAKPIVAVKSMVNWNSIKYTGFIHNPGSKKLLAMMNINGKETMLGEGETAEQVKLLKNLKDSVKVTYQGETKYITMNNKGQ